jgi:hypothetical protein
MNSYSSSTCSCVSSASSRASSLASACKPRRHRQWRRAPLARFLASASSLNERLVCEPLPGRSVNETFEPRQGVILDVALVQPEPKFANVAVKMGWRDDRPRSARASRRQRRFRCRSSSRLREHIRQRQYARSHLAQR